MVDDAAGPYGAGALPSHLDQLSPTWLTHRLQNRYAGVVVRDWEIVEVRNGLGRRPQDGLLLLTLQTSQQARA